MKKLIFIFLLYGQCVLASFAPQSKLLMFGQGGAARASMDPKKLITNQIQKSELIKEKIDREAQAMVAQSKELCPRFEKTVPSLSEQRRLLEKIKEHTLKEISTPGRLPSLRNVPHVWSPNSRFALISSVGRLSIWDSHTEHAVPEANTMRDSKGVRWSPDSTALLEYSSFDAHALDAQTGQRRCFWREDDCIMDAAWSPDSTMILIALADRNAYIRDSKTGRKIHTLPGVLESYSVAWNQDSSLALTASDYEVCLWDAKTGKKKIGVQRELGNGGVAWSRDLNWLLMRSLDHKGCIYNMQTGAAQWTLDKIDSVDAHAWSPDAQLVVARCEASKKLCVWDVRTGQQMSAFNDAKQFKEFAWNHNSTILHTQSADNIMRSWRPQTGKMCYSLQLAQDYPFAQALSHDSQWMLTHVDNKTVRIQDVQTGTIKQDLSHTEIQGPEIENPDTVTRIAWSPNGKFVIVQRGGYWNAKQWNVELITNEGARQEEKAFKENIDPEKYRLLHVLETYVPAALAKYFKAIKYRSPWDEPQDDQAADFLKTLQLVNSLGRIGNKIALLAGAVALSQPVMPGYSMPDAVQALMKFHPARVTAILKLHEIHHDEIALHLAKTMLFECPTGALQEESSTAFLKGDDIKRDLYEFIWGVVAEGTWQKDLLQTPAQKAQIENDTKAQKEEKALKFKIDLAKQQEKDKDKTIAVLFQGINLGDLKQVKASLNPVTVLCRNPDAKNGNFRTPLMEVIWKSEKQPREYDAIFNEFLTYKGEYVREGGAKEIRVSDLAAQDFDKNTALILAIKLHRFDYALKIALVMNKDIVLHKVFKNIDSQGKTAYSLALDKQEKYKNDNDFIQLLNVLEVHHKDIHLKRRNFFF